MPTLVGSLRPWNQRTFGAFIKHSIGHTQHHISSLSHSMNKDNNTLIQTLVVDDEPLAQELVADYVSQTPFLQLTKCCSNAAEALQTIAQGNIELVFLDIQMPGLSGLSLAKALSGRTLPKIVFTTAYDEYALEGYKLDVADYLLKPFDYDEFLRAATKVHRLIELERKVAAADSEQAKVLESQPTANATQSTPNAEPPYFFVKSEYKLVRVVIDKVCYIEGLKDYVKIFVQDQPKPILTLSTLKQMEAKLQPHEFMRLHKSFIVNMKMLTRVERNMVCIADAKIPIGDGYRAKFQEALSKMTL